MITLEDYIIYNARLGPTNDHYRYICWSCLEGIKRDKPYYTIMLSHIGTLEYKRERCNIHFHIDCFKDIAGNDYIFLPECLDV